MRVLGGLASGIGLALMAAFGAGTALAQEDEPEAFMDCMEPGYLGSFPDAPTAEDLTCVEHFRFEIATPDGTRAIRGISDLGADWAAPPALVAQVERGARLAGNAFALLGRYSIDNVTILILDDVHSTEELSNHGTGESVLGVALSDRELEPDQSQECLITIYALSPSGDDGSMAVTVAHEIFHCVQGATYAGAKYQSYGLGGTWWIEGAAEAFAAAAVPDSPAFTDRSGAFDAGVADRVALNDMEHESVIFFYWLMQTQGGLSALMPFQDAMADRGGAEAQHAAMRGALPAEGWAAFAQAYADSTISHAQGGSLASDPPEGTYLEIAETARHSLPLDPFTITLGQAGYGCGLWGNTATPDLPVLAFREEDARDWGAIPAELDTREGRQAHWRLVAMPVDDSLDDGELNVERRSGCNPCMGLDKVDACLVGTWKMSGGGPAEWMRAQGFPATVATSGEEEMTLRSDGIFSTVGFDVSVDENRNGVEIEGNGSVAPAHGSWSADAGVLNFCAGVGGMSGTMTVTTEDGSSEGNVGAGAGSISMSYSCSEPTVFRPRSRCEGLPDMVTDYVKVAE